MERPDANAFIEEMKGQLETAIRFQDAPAASVERVLKIINKYSIQQQQWEEVQRKKEAWKEKEMNRVNQEKSDE